MSQGKQVRATVQPSSYVNVVSRAYLLRRKC